MPLVIVPLRAGLEQLRPAECCSRGPNDLPAAVRHRRRQRRLVSAGGGAAAATAGLVFAAPRSGRDQTPVKVIEGYLSCFCLLFEVYLSCTIWGNWFYIQLHSLFFLLIFLSALIVRLFNVQFPSLHYVLLPASINCQLSINVCIHLAIHLYLSTALHTHLSERDHPRSTTPAAHFGNTVAQECKIIIIFLFISLVSDK